MRPKPLPRIPFALALRRRPRVRRALVALLALVTGLLVQRTVSQAEDTRDAWGRGEPVAIATRDLEPGQVVSAADIRRVELPPAAVPPGALGRSPEGRIVRAGIHRGEVLTARRLAAGGVAGVAALLPRGSRAVAIPVDPGSAPPLRLGDAVDLVAVVAGDAGPRAGLLAAAATVVDVGERSITVAVDADVVPRVVAALGAGAVIATLVAP